MKFFILYLVYTFVIFPNVPSTGITAPSPEPTITKIEAKAPEVKGVEAINHDSIVDIINQVRAESGCKKPLKEHAGLIKAAKVRADYVSAGNWTHDGNWKQIYPHYHYRYIGEDLARDWPDDQSVVNAWLNSKTHREVMLNCTYNEVGIGRNGSYVVSLFGKR